MQIKIIDFQIKDEDRYVTVSECPRYVASIRIKIGTTYVGVEDMPMHKDFDPKSPLDKQKAVEAALGYLQHAMLHIQQGGE